MSLLSRINAGLQAFRGFPNTTTQFAQALDELEQSGQLKQVMFTDEVLAELSKEQPMKNNVEVFQSTRIMSSLFSNAYSRVFANIQSLSDPNKQYPHGDPRRDLVLAEFWKHEPLLSGAVYSMVSKMASLSWTVTGKKRLAHYFAQIYTEALSMNRHGWGDFIGATAQDFFTTDRGAFWATPRSGEVLTELAVLDSLCCGMTGNYKKPVVYNSYVTGQTIWFEPDEVTHFASMVSPREELFGMGFCAVSRAYKSARILMGLSNYDWEKLNNLPPEGVAAISGLTMDEFRDSLAMWQASRTQNKSLTYPQVLWLLSSQPSTNVSVDFVGFSQIPESFDRKAVIEQYVNLLALDFGVDAREFWPISSSSLGTAAESEIQHMKAKGKGPGEFISVIERWMNRNMPEGVDFGFDTQDIGEDMTAAQIAKEWINAFMPLYMPQKGAPAGQPGAPSQPLGKLGPSPESPTKQEEDETPPPQQPKDDDKLITKDQFLRLLVDRRVLPNWIVDDKRTIITDVGVMEKELHDLDPDTPISITWKNKDGVGTWEITKSAVYEIISVPDAKLHKSEQKRSEAKFGGIGADSADALTQLKQLADEILENKLERNIRGKPLPSGEELRGPKVNASAIKAEIERWRQHPILSQYIPEDYQNILEVV